MMSDSVASTVALIRQQYGFTQEALARHLGVTFSTVNAWEAGRSRPQPRHRARLQQLVNSESETGTVVSILISDIVTRRRTTTIRALTDASAALSQAIAIHEESDEIAALLTVGRIQPDIIIFSARRSLIGAEQLAARLTTLPLTQSSRLLIMEDQEPKGATPTYPAQVNVASGPLTLSDAGAILRDAANRKFVALA